MTFYEKAVEFTDGRSDRRCSNVRVFRFWKYSGYYRCEDGGRRWAGHTGGEDRGACCQRREHPRGMVGQPEAGGCDHRSFRRVRQGERRELHLRVQQLQRLLGDVSHSVRGQQSSGDRAAGDGPVRWIYQQRLAAGSDPLCGERSTGFERLRRGVHIGWKL